MSAPLSRTQVLLAAVGAALLGWWLPPAVEAPPALVQPRADGWQLPALPRVADQTTLAATVLSAPYWGSAPVSAAAAAAAAGAPPPDPRWRIAAIYGTGPQRGVMVAFAEAGKPPGFLKVGERLPSGHRIVRIEEREVCIQIGRREYRLGVERSAI